MKIYQSKYDSPIGVIFLKANNISLIRISFNQPEDFKENNNALIKMCKLQLDEYFNGNRKQFTIPIMLPGTNFQNKVWKALKNIPYGETVSYKFIAQEIGHENAYRAVGSANNKNFLPIVIPCHRVIGTNGKIIGYAGGTDKKKYLLEFEKNNL